MTVRADWRRIRCIPTGVRLETGHPYWLRRLWQDPLCSAPDGSQPKSTAAT